MREQKQRQEQGAGERGAVSGQWGGGAMRAHPSLGNRDLQRRLERRRAEREAAAAAATRAANARAFREAMKIFARSHIPGRFDKLRVIVHRAVLDIATGHSYDVDKYGTAELELLVSKVSTVVLGLAVDVVGGMMLRSLGRLTELGEVIPTKLELDPEMAAHDGAEAVRTGVRLKPDLGNKDPFSAALKLHDKGRLVIESLPHSGVVDLTVLMDKVFHGVSAITDQYVEATCTAIDTNVDDDFAATTWESISQTVAVASGGELQPTEAFVRTWMMAQLLGVPADMVDTVEGAREILRTLLVTVHVTEDSSTSWGRPALDAARDGTHQADRALDHAVISSDEKGALDRDKNNRRLMALAITRPERLQAEPQP